MAQATDLVRAILLERCPDEDAARQVIDRALAMEVDPLDYIVHRYGLSAAQVMERAATWAGFAFSPVVPLTGGHAAPVSRLDSLGEMHSIRVPLYDREVIYSTPGFGSLVQLRGELAERPELSRRICLVPGAAVRSAFALTTEAQLLEEARQRLSRRWPFASASFDLPLWVRILFVLALGGLAVLALLAPLIAKPLLLVPLAVLIVPPAIFRVVALGELRRPPVVVPPLDDEDLPVYSVLVPLRDEANMVPQLARAMAAIDYPSEKLDLKFVVERRSSATVAALEPVLANPRFELVTVPDALPRTKPKALDFALPLVRGEHVVVYDAEDIPAPGQLRRAAARFAADRSLDCLQAELRIDNARENWLTALFAGEYAGLFGLLLPLFARARLPVPLGGTSNHFRTAALREVGGWDAFNVTEDADLGVRLARLRYRTATLDSTTGEEAPVTLSSWMAQRTRWMKGWMQTFIVHNRSPLRFRADIGWRGFIAFQIHVGGLIATPLLHTVFVLALVGQWLSGQSGFGIDDGWDAAYLGILVLGYGSAVALTVAGLRRTGLSQVTAWQVLLPVYWMLHAVATIRAAIELLTRPYFWAKTVHGQTRVER